jgi:hypothetical protein
MWSQGKNRCNSGKSVNALTGRYRSIFFYWSRSRMKSYSGFSSRSRQTCVCQISMSPRRRSCSFLGVAHSLGFNSIKTKQKERTNQMLSITHCCCDVKSGFGVERRRQGDIRTSADRAAELALVSTCGYVPKVSPRLHHKTRGYILYVRSARWRFTRYVC